jgi:hypothetical protein
VQGTIAQVIALTTYGNASITGLLRAAPSAFFPANSTFTFCEYVRFVDLKPAAGGWEESAYADDPAAWFARLKQEGVRGLRMTYASTDAQKLRDRNVSDRMLVGFVGGGGRWLIEALTPRGSDFWEGRWEVGDRERKDQKIWRVSYGRVASKQPTLDRPALEMATLRNQLAANLEALGNFARKHRMDRFARAFDAGMAQLSSQEPSKQVHHSDLAPDNVLPVPAAQLLGAAQAAWVFGGMGSWNDAAFDAEDQGLYERLSEELYQLLNAAIVTAANTSAPAGRAKRER